MRRLDVRAIALGVAAGALAAMAWQVMWLQTPTDERNAGNAAITVATACPT